MMKNFLFVSWDGNKGTLICEESTKKKKMKKKIQKLRKVIFVNFSTSDEQRKAEKV